MKDKTLDTKDIERPTWRKPVIMRIELKRTLSHGGSGVDAHSLTDFLAAADK